MISPVSFNQNKINLFKRSSQRNLNQSQNNSFQNSNLSFNGNKLKNKEDLIKIANENQSSNDFQMFLLVPKKDNKSLNFKGNIVQKKPTVLITGGTGYIGSHCLLDLIKKNFDCIVFDKHIKNKEKLEELISKINKKNQTNCTCTFIEGNLLQPKHVEKAFAQKDVDVVLHLAGVTENKESFSNPQKYYSNNVAGSINLLNSMNKNGVSKFVFSSTGLTYGKPRRIPITENHIQTPTSPYGRSKLMIERIVKDYSKKYNIKSNVIRMFNVAGSDNALPPNKSKGMTLIPAIIKSISEDKPFTLMGSDFDTKDGSCIRDFVHVKDAANGFSLAIKNLLEKGKGGFFNLSSGDGFSLKEVLKSCERITNKKATVKIGNRVPGDPDKIIADNSKIKEKLGWQTEHSLDDIVESVWQQESKQGGNE